MAAVYMILCWPVSILQKENAQWKNLSLLPKKLLSSESRTSAKHHYIYIRHDHYRIWSVELPSQQGARWSHRYCKAIPASQRIILHIRCNQVFLDSFHSAMARSLVQQYFQHKKLLINSSICLSSFCHFRQPKSWFSVLDWKALPELDKMREEWMHQIHCKKHKKPMLRKRQSSRQFTAVDIQLSQHYCLNLEPIYNLHPIDCKAIYPNQQACVLHRRNQQEQQHSLDQNFQARSWKKSWVCN